MSLRRLFPCLKESKSAEKVVEKVSDDEEEQGQVDDGGLNFSILRIRVNFLRCQNGAF